MWCRAIAEPAPAYPWRVTDAAPAHTRGRSRGDVIAVIAGAVVVVIVCTALGFWQWSRAFAYAPATTDDPAVALAEVIAPAESSNASGTRVEVTGAWADADAAVVPGRYVEDQDAELVVMALDVPQPDGGTGRLAVLVGWASPENAADAVAAARAAVGTEVTITGYLRGSEAIRDDIDVPAVEIDGASYVSAMSTPELANLWGGTLYALPMVADVPLEPLSAMPAPEVDRDLNLRSLLYAFEWWIFAGFAVFIAWRWLRDNGRVDSDDPPEGDDRWLTHPQDCQGRCCATA